MAKIKLTPEQIVDARMHHYVWARVSDDMSETIKQSTNKTAENAYAIKQLANAIARQYYIVAANGEVDSD